MHSSNFRLLLTYGVMGVGALFLLLSLNPTRFVSNGENLVVFTWFEGVKSTPLEPGFHFVTPFITTTHPFDIKTQALTWKDNDDSSTYAPRILALSRDGQEIRAEVTLQFRVSNSPLLFNSLGLNYIDQIAPFVQSTIVSETSAFAAQDLYSTKRPILQAQIRERVSSHLNSFGITVLDLLLRDVTFDPDFVSAIESKTIAENQLAKKSYEIQQARQDARTTISQAAAEAGKLQAKANALKENPQYLDVVRSSVYGDTLDTLIKK
ncbi:MAG TPA: prohibitin family protein [Stenomitos sp.]